MLTKKIVVSHIFGYKNLMDRYIEKGQKVNKFKYLGEILTLIFF